MYRFTRRLAIVTIALVCAASLADTFRRVRDAAPPVKPDAPDGATAAVAPTSARAPAKREFALANVRQGDDALTEADMGEPLRRGSEVFVAEWVRERRQEMRAQGREAPDIATSVSYERIGGRKFMVTHLRADNRRAAAIEGIVDGKTRTAWCVVENDAGTPLASRECVRAIEETFGVKSGR